MGNGKGVGTKIMFGMRIGIWLGDLGWKLALEIKEKYCYLMPIVSGNYLIRMTMLHDPK